MGQSNGNCLGALWRSFVVFVGVFFTPLAAADGGYVDSWGPDVGTVAPLLAANDQAGTPQTLETLTGEGGLLVVFNRSADW